MNKGLKAEEKSLPKYQNGTRLEYQIENDESIKLELIRVTTESFIGEKILPRIYADERSSRMNLPRRQSTYHENTETRGKGNETEIVGQSS